MQKTKAAIAGILALFAVASASAQQFPTVPDHTVIGRIGVGGQSGPSQAIPFAQLLSNIVGPQSANRVYAGPASGVAALPAFRALVGADLPAFSFPPSPALRLGLTAAATIYVNPSSVSTANCNGSTCQPGSLANTCLSIASPCLTLQQATNLALSWDNNGFAITVQLSDGTYTAGTYIDGAVVGGGRSQAGGATVYPLLFNGNNSTPANVIVNTASDACFQATNYAEVAITNMLLRCVYDVYALLHGKIFVNGGVITDGVAVVGSQHYYASRYGYIEVNGANFARGAGTPDTLFQSTHHGNIRLGVSGSPTITLQANITVSLATAYTLTQAEITATAGFVFVPGAFAITGQCWRVEDASIQWAGGSGVCNNANGFLGTVAGTINGGFGDFYVSGAWCVPVSTELTTGTDATFNTPTCNGRLARYIIVEMVGAGGGAAGSGTTPGGPGAGGATCLKASGTACTSPLFSAPGGAVGSSTAGSGIAAGGTASGCDRNINGGSGGAPSNQNSSFGGAGGVSVYGGNGPGGFSTTVQGPSAVANSGSGGGGAGQNTTANAGGGGGAGAYCYKMITPPLTSYVYTIGAAGSGGSAGTGGAAGGNGGTGKMSINAYWNFLLKRDVNGDNDNSPMWLNAAA